MSDVNKALARRFYEEVFNEKRIDAIDELCHPDLIDHAPMPGQRPGREGTKAMFVLFMKAFPDMHVEVEELVAERDLVVSRFSVTATHTGELLGAPPTGKKVTFHAMDMLRVRDGMAAEVWHYGDDMEVLMGLGVKLPA